MAGTTERGSMMLIAFTWICVAIAIICVAKVAQRLLHHQQVMMERLQCPTAEDVASWEEAQKRYAVVTRDREGRVVKQEDLHTLDDILKEGGSADVGE